MSHAYLKARHLNADHIGETIRFVVRNPVSKTVAVMDSELRQVYHDGSSTTITIGDGAAEEYTLDHETSVLLSPAPKYGGTWAEALFPTEEVR